MWMEKPSASAKKVRSTVSRWPPQWEWIGHWPTAQYYILRMKCHIATTLELFGPPHSIPNQILSICGTCSKCSSFFLHHKVDMFWMLLFILPCEIRLQFSNSKLCLIYKCGQRSQMQSYKFLKPALNWYELPRVVARETYFGHPPPPRPHPKYVDYWLLPWLIKLIHIVFLCSF